MHDFLFLDFTVVKDSGKEIEVQSPMFKGDPTETMSTSTCVVHSGKACRRTHIFIQERETSKFIDGLETELLLIQAKMPAKQYYCDFSLP